MIFGRHSVLKRGCSTWDQGIAPRAEFESRLETVRRELAGYGLDALVIYGDNYSFADICYLTNYFPKVRGGIAVVPRQGSVSLLLNIGSRDVPFAKTLTWVEDVRASNQIGADGAKLLEEKGLETARLGMADSGHGFPLPQLEEMQARLPGVVWTPCDALIAPLRREKTPPELAALRAAGGLLQRVLNAAASIVEPGRKEYEIVADIDRFARDNGAEDIRILGGERRLLPPSFKQTGLIANHWALHLAVQHERYWAEAGRTFILADDAQAKAAYEQAQDIVEQMTAELRPQNRVAAIGEVGRQQLDERYTVAAMYGLGHGIGLNQWEAPFLNEDDAREVSAPMLETSTLKQGMTLALRVVLNSHGKLILYGSSYEVTEEGPKSLLTI
jgi:Xaa-Pro dipeptidase